MSRPSEQPGQGHRCLPPWRGSSNSLTLQTSHSPITFTVRTTCNLNATGSHSHPQLPGTKLWVLILELGWGMGGQAPAGRVMFQHIPGNPVQYAESDPDRWHLGLLNMMTKVCWKTLWGFAPRLRVSFDFAGHLRLSHAVMFFAKFRIHVGISILFRMSHSLSMLSFCLNLSIKITPGHRKTPSTKD